MIKEINMKTSIIDHTGIEVYRHRKEAATVADQDGFMSSFDARNTPRDASSLRISNIACSGNKKY